MSDQKSKEFFSKYSSFYSWLAKRKFGVHYRKLLNVVSNLSQQPQTLLDVASGPGDFLLLVKQKYPKIHLFGFDISEKMNALLKKKIPEIEVRLGSVDQLPWPDNYFDCVTCSFAFHHFSHPTKVLEEVYRIVKPSGVFVVLDVSPGLFWKPVADFLTSLFDGGFETFYTTEEMEVLFGQSGFNHITQHRYGVVWGYTCTLGYKKF